MCKKNQTGRSLAALAAAFIMLFGVVADIQTVSAAEKTEAKKKESWKIEKKCVFYYKDGKKLTGLEKLNGKYCKTKCNDQSEQDHGKGHEAYDEKEGETKSLL